MNGKRICALAGGVLLAWALAVQADPPTEFDYQGKILIDGIPLTGEGYFKYAIADEAGSTNFWAHDGTAIGEPGTFLTNDCYNGVFSASVGGAPMGAVDPTVFALNTALYLRVWFSADGVAFNEMLPAQRLLSAPYAVNADLLDGRHAADILAGYAETDPVFSASDAAGIAAADIANWNAAHGWGDHAAVGYLTSYAEFDPLFGASPAFGITLADLANWNAAFGWGDHSAAGYVTTETDPVWTAASNLYYQKTEADGRFVDVAGDTMTGTLTINSGAGNDLVVSSAGNNVRIGSAAVALTGGVAVGPSADGSANGAAVGMSALANNEGAAIGHSADGRNTGAAVGYQADGSANGAAVGRDSSAISYGAAVGAYAESDWYGAALGRSANGATNGVAMGYDADGSMTNVAIGVAADALQGTERIAIGHNVTNDLDETARIRGSLYLDGGVSIHGRRPFATGAFQQLLPLPPLDNVVYVASNGTPFGSSAIDRPFDTPQNGYNFAAAKFTNTPATLVIAAGTYPGLNMNAGNVHVIGESRAELDSLTITSGANFIRGKQRVENLIVAGAAIVAADLGEDVKFHNCRFAGGLLIYGPNVEVQDCFATIGDGTAVTVGDGVNNIDNVALTQSSFANESMFGTLIVNSGVGNFEVIGCQFENKMTGSPCIQDLETTGILPLHLYTHNYLKGTSGPGAVPALLDSATGFPTIAFYHNTVLGHVGVNGNPQYYANNTVYGLINNVAGPGAPGWIQAGSGTVPPDASNNTEHDLSYPVLPAAWLD
ncbi:MAG: hypothetical protein AB7V22_02455 [Kiritimatiellia bacterium]